MKVQILVLLCGVFASEVEGFGGGAGAPACLDFTPRHNNSVRQTSNPPYSLTVDLSNVATGGKVTVTLKATAENGTFKGFLVQARCTQCTTSDTAIVSGTFAKSNANDATKTMNCNNETSNSMTHSDSSDKTTVSFTWTAPASADLKGIKFRAAVVEEFYIWWNNIESPEVTVSSAVTSVPSSALLFAAFAVIIAALTY